MTVTRHIIHALTVLMLAGCFSSCIYDKEDVEPDRNPVPAGNVLSLDISVPAMRAEAADGNDKYVAGVDFENYIDLSDQGLRIYIFDSANRFITRLVPMGTVSTDDTAAPRRYTVTGEFPDSYSDYSTFKVVVLANWPTYIDDLVEGVSTINDLCNAEWAQFNGMTDFRLSADNKIPFYGVREYTGVSFKAGETTVLAEPVTLLRAMAKVEVVLDNEELSLQNVELKGLNYKGYCAPYGVFSQTDYDHNGSWNDDYVKTLHLPDNYNLPGAEDKVAKLHCLNRRDGELKETWVCYVPEYRNTLNPNGLPSAKCYLRLLFDFQDDTDKPFEIYFKDYDDNHKPVDGSDFDIQRNNCYTFIVNITSGGLFIKCEKWGNAYDNKFIIE